MRRSCRRDHSSTLAPAVPAVYNQLDAVVIVIVLHILTRGIVYVQSPRSRSILKSLGIWKTINHALPPILRR